jgi:MFS family permease
MLGGSVCGGYLAQLTDLGVPYVVRSVVLAFTFAFAFARMRDIGFTPEGSGRTFEKVRGIVKASIEHGLRVPAVRWTMLAGLLSGGVTIYAFYALQPYLLELYRDPSAYGIAGLAAAVVAGAEIVGGLAAPRVRRLFERRTTALLTGTLGSALSLALIGLIQRFWAVLALVVLWGLLWAALGPIRQAYLNAQIPSRERATILSFDSLLGSSGGVVVQPALGRAADVWSYGTSYLLAAAVNALALPFIALARREHVAADTAEREERAANSLPEEGSRAARQ